MKSYIAVIMLFLLLTGCENTNIPNKECPLPKDDGTGLGPKIPIPHNEQRVSYDGEKLAFSSVGILKVLNLKTGYVQVVNITSKLPSNIRAFSADFPQWCPYDNNRLLIAAVMSIDTVGDGKRYVYAQGLYILSLVGSEFINVTPSKYGKAPVGLPFCQWLVGSSPKIDSIYFHGNVIYIPQRDTFINASHPALSRQTKDGKHYCGTVYLPEPDYDLLIDGELINLQESAEQIGGWSSWSPSGKYLALSNYIDENRYFEIWILDIEKYLSEKQVVVPMKIINLRKNFCMYAFNGMHAEFITDSTLAVSMHKDGDDYSFLWEITINGQIVRQLTFAP